MSNSNQFNKHGFLIRRRSVREIFDLTCLLLRIVGLRAIGYSLILGVPVFLVNWFILPTKVISFLSFYEPTDFLYFPSYLFFFTVLTLLEGDFVFSPMILFLGEWFFHPDEKISKRKIFRQWCQLLPQIFFYLVFFRIFFIYSRQICNILLLEKTPFRKNKWKTSTWQRSGLFQKASSISGGTNLALNAWVSEIIFLIIMIPSGFFLLHFWLLLFFEGATIISVLMLGIIFPLYCWSIAFFISIYKFLTYLHLRIVQEGWDLEIAFKAELLRHREKIDELFPLSQKDLYESFSSNHTPNSRSEKSCNFVSKKPLSDSRPDALSASILHHSFPDEDEFSKNDSRTDEPTFAETNPISSQSSSSGQESHS